MKKLEAWLVGYAKGHPKEVERALLTKDQQALLEELLNPEKEDLSQMKAFTFGKEEGLTIWNDAQKRHTLLLQLLLKFTRK